MGTFNDLNRGDQFMTPARTITDEDIDILIEVGGYTHPLFTDPAYLEKVPFESRPMPGEGALHIMGGLIEQSGRFDESTVALVGLEDAQFKRPVFAGDTLHVLAEVIDKQEKGERGLITFRWSCVNERGEICVVTRAKMLFAR